VVCEGVLTEDDVLEKFDDWASPVPEDLLIE
jgi:hypothetical protein